MNECNDLRCVKERIELQEVHRNVVEDDHQHEQIGRAEDVEVLEHDEISAEIAALSQHLLRGIEFRCDESSVRLLNVRVLDEDQEQHLTEVSEETDVEHDIGLRNETAAVIEGVANRVHRVRNNCENSVEGQVLIHQEKEVAPVCFISNKLIQYCLITIKLTVSKIMLYVHQAKSFTTRYASILAHKVKMPQIIPTIHEINHKNDILAGNCSKV